jgi:hypothetical protein
MPKSYYKPGGWNCICDLTGKKLKNDEVRKTWDGFYVRVQSWEPRNPLDFVRGVRDNIAVPFTRPGQATAINPTTQTYTCKASDNGQPIFCDATNGGFTVYLDPNPTVSETITIQKTDETSNVVTVNGNGNVMANLPSANQQFALNAQDEGVVLQWHLGQWNLLDTMPTNKIPPISNTPVHKMWFTPNTVNNPATSDTLVNQNQSASCTVITQG